MYIYIYMYTYTRKCPCLMLLQIVLLVVCTLGNDISCCYMSLQKGVSGDCYKLSMVCSPAAGVFLLIEKVFLIF
jgi:hypothetical protein